MAYRSLGVDVSAGRGLDLILLEAAKPPKSYPHVEIDGLLKIVDEVNPSIVAVDSPPRWCIAGRSREAQRQLARFCIHSYAVPVDPGDHPFYSWMRAGFEVFARLSPAYPLYLSGPTLLGHSLEVFPHASAVGLAGSLPPPGPRKIEWRRRVLSQRGLLTDGLYATCL